ncbi:MAG: glycosyltransferase [Calditrichia bacterium]
MIINSSKIFGGTERWALLVAEQLHAAGHSVFFGYRFEAMKEKAERLGIPSVYFPMLNDADFYTIGKMVRFFKSRQIDLVIPTKVKEYWLATVASRISGTKAIIRLGIDRPVKDKWKNRMVYGKWSDGIIVNAEAIKSTLIESSFISPDKISVIYNGVHIPDLTPSTNQSGDLIYISVGSLIERKKFDLLLEAFKMVFGQKTGLPARLWIVGDGPERDRLQTRVARLGIADLVKFWGQRNDVAALLRKSDVFILASENEGFPNAGLEAMAFGLPVVLSRVAGAEEIIQPEINGFLVEPNDVEQLAAKMALLATHPEIRARVGRAARQFVEERCSLKSMLNKMEETFYGILNENK